MDVVGFTTSLPIEAILAAGARPLDLNNAFVNGPDTERDIACAEAAGIPRNICAWIKGIYGTVKRLGIRRIVGVLSGDCSYTEGLLDVLRDEGVEVVGFHFPAEPDAAGMRRAIERLASALGARLDALEATWRQLRPPRGMLAELDRMTWQHGTVSGEDNFRMLINASDFRGEPAAYAAEVRRALEAARKRPDVRHRLRIGLVGIPPAFSDLHAYLAGLGVHVAYNEMPREFAMLEAATDIYEQYSLYTYPYPFRWRLERIRREAAARALDGLIHYVQAFCYRSMHDRLLRRHLPAPVLALEGDRPARVGAREGVRIEAFIEMLAARKQQ